LCKFRPSLPRATLLILEVGRERNLDQTVILDELFPPAKFFFKLKYPPHVNEETNTSRKNTVFEQHICEFPKFYNIYGKKNVEKCLIYWQFSWLLSFRTIILFYFFLLLYVYKRELHPRNYMNILTCPWRVQHTQNNAYHKIWNSYNICHISHIHQILQVKKMYFITMKNSRSVWK
jgi:hypothetical protein